MSVLRRIVHAFETDAKLQFRFHLVMMVFWMANFVAGTIVMALWPTTWVDVGVYYVFALSVYANWDTDYDAVSASLAAMRSEELLQRDDERA